MIMFSAPARGRGWGEGTGVLASPERGGAARKRGGGVRCGTQNTNWDAPRRIRTGPRCPLWGKCREAAKGVPLVTLSCYHSTNHTPSVSPYGLPAPPSGSRGIVRIRPGFHKAVSACRETPQSGPLGLPAPLSGALFSQCKQPRLRQRQQSPRPGWRQPPPERSGSWSWRRRRSRSR